MVKTASKNTAQKQKISIKLRDKSKSRNELLDVIAREEEYNTLKKRIMFHLSYGGNACIYITGVPGCGKTHTVRALISRLDCTVIYFNCSLIKSKIKVYDELRKELVKKCNKNGSKCNEMKKRGVLGLRMHLINCNCHHVVVLDEVDFLSVKNDSILYNLLEMTMLENAKLIFICISNTLGTLSSKIGSRIGNNRIDFMPYNSKQLKRIFENKTEPEKLTDLVVKRVASVTGDIRRVHSVMSQADKMNIGEVNKLITSMEANLLDRFVGMLSTYHKLIMLRNIRAKADLHGWFEDFKSFCRLRNIQKLNYVEFTDCVDDLCRFGIFNRKGLRVTSEYLSEELENALKKDKNIAEYIEPEQ